MNNKPSSLERVIASEPVDRLAGMVTGKGVHWEPSNRMHNLHSDIPLKYRPIQLGTGAKDLAGLKFGRFEVLGVYVEKTKGKIVWVVRCSCGAYEVRASKAIKNPKNDTDRCFVCRKLEYVQGSYSRALERRKFREHAKTNGERQ